MTGNMDAYTLNADFKTHEDVADIYTRSGKYPALVGFDFLFSTGPNASGSWNKSYDEKALFLAKNLWSQGGIPAFSWHWKDPTDTKDAFWNCRNITVKNSYISGEYFGWNSENIVMENCTLESLQGMCYIKGLVMKNCKLIDTTLSFEYSEVDATIEGHIDSVKNPSSGRIHAGSIGELIMEDDRVDTSATIIETEE